MKRVAIIHDWLTNYAGSERVLEQLLIVYPEAALFSVCDFVSGAERGFLQGRKPQTTFVQHLPFARKFYRSYLPLMPLAIEQLDISRFDLIVSSSHAVAKGVIVGPDQLHISYVHSPVRYAWDLQHQYMRESGLDRRWIGWIARVLLHGLRMWDARTANGVDHFVANSEFIGRRIRRVYGREAQVIYPPVDVDGYELREAKEDFYLTASRMVPYKRIDLVVEAFARMPDKRLVVIGDGPDFSKIRGKAGPNVEFLGYQPFDVLRDHMQRARAFVFAAEEDFGITPVEAQACGTPVIAYGKGGALETVVGLESGEPPTGVFFDAQEVDAVVAAVETFERERHAILPSACRRNAERFSADRFRREFKACVHEQLERRRSARVGGRSFTGSRHCDASVG